MKPRVTAEESIAREADVKDCRMCGKPALFRTADQRGNAFGVCREHKSIAVTRSREMSEHVIARLVANRERRISIGQALTRSMPNQGR